MNLNGLAAYGPLAERLARSLGPTTPVVVFDHIGAAEALRDCAARRFHNQAFFVRVALQREYSLRADAVAPNILDSFKGADERRTAFEQAAAGILQFNGKILHAIPAYSDAALRLMRGALGLSDGLVIGSQAERRRVQDILRTDPPVRALALRDPAVPLSGAIQGTRKDAVVIWAPHLTGNAAASFVSSLSDLQLAVVLICATAPTHEMGAEWVSPENAASALVRAKLIVDVSAHACDSALSLAAWQVPLIVDVESGAQEHIEHVRVFDRKRASSIYEAAASALGSAAPKVLEHSSVPAFHVQEVLSDGPLVSILIPTFDRPVLLSHALRSAHSQTYRNTEIVVVIDGGPRLDALAAEFPNVRFLHRSENNVVASMNAGFAATTGTYVTVLNDDDLFFPNHVASLVTALERSGAAAAHADVLTAFLRGDDAQWLLYGLESNMSNEADVTSLLVSNRIGATSAMFRRACVGERFFDVAIPLYRDYEFWLRLASRYGMIHVPRITSCYTIRNQGSAQQSNMSSSRAVDAYNAIYERYPVPDRPLLQQRRAQMLQSLSQTQVRLAERPAAEIAPVPWPLF